MAYRPAAGVMWRAWRYPARGVASGETKKRRRKGVEAKKAAKACGEEAGWRAIIDGGASEIGENRRRERKSARSKMASISNGSINGHENEERKARKISSNVAASWRLAWRMAKRNQLMALSNVWYRLYSVISMYENHQPASVAWLSAISNAAMAEISNGWRKLSLSMAYRRGSWPAIYS